MVGGELVVEKGCERCFRALRMAALIAAVSLPVWAQTGETTKPAEANASAAAGREKPAAGQIAHSDSSYVIGLDDVLAINVWKEPDVSRTLPVRSDGRISLPLVGEMTAAGQTPLQLEQEIAKRLEAYISEPEVNVIVQDSKSRKINILGMVARPGAYLLTGSTTVLDAIAMAGGFRDFAKQKAIYVLRPSADGSEQRIAFNYKEVIKGKNPEQNIRLQPRDTVVVP
jgi:polysaccharide export outer membrane protein